jgi:hypothetical protein
MPTDTGAKKSYSKLLYSYAVRPKVSFETQQEGEEVLLLVRAHPATFVPWIVTAVFFFLLPMFLNVFLVGFLEFREILFINLFWYSGVFSYVFLQILGWLFNVGIITNLRIIDIDYSMVLNKSITATSIEDVADASEKTTGFIRSIIQYGDVHIQTAGIHQNIEFSAIPYPSAVVATVNELMK